METKGTSLTDVLGELDAGVFEQKINRALSDVALGVISTGKAGKVTITFDLKQIEASSADGLPQGFRFTCTPYDGLNEYTFYLRMSVLTGDEKPMFALRWRARETQIEQIGQDFKAKLLAGIADKATMQLGTFDPGQ